MIGNEFSQLNRRNLILGTAAGALAAATLGATTPARAAGKATIVLVHGAWHGGWCYRRVADILSRNGHKVYTPTLTGLGERSHLSDPKISLDIHIQDVVNVFKWEDLKDVVLVGHSYGGIVVSGAAEHLQESISSIVFLDAFVPANGQSLLDYQPPERRKMVEDAAAQNGGMVKPLSAATMKVNEKDRSWVDAKMVPQALPTFSDKVRLTGARERIKKKAFVFAESYNAPYSAAFMTKVKSDPTWKLHTIPCGHDVMIDMPEETARIIDEAA